MSDDITGHGVKVTEDSFPVQIQSFVNGNLHCAFDRVVVEGGRAV